MSNITEKEIEKLSEERYPVTDIIGNWLDIPTRNKQEGYIEGYKAALQNKVSDKAPNKNEIIKEAKRLWDIPNKLEAIKLIIKLGYSLKDAKAYCEDNFDKVSDISAEKWKVFSHTSALGNTGDYMSDCGIENGTISFYCDKPDDITNEELQKVCDNLNASIVNEKDNIPADFKQVTGHNSPKEMIAYEKGREDEQEVIMKWIEQWDGSSNSAMGTLLKKKFDEKKDNAGSWVKASERLPGVIDKKCTPVFIRAEIKGYGGKVYISKRVAFYFPDHFKTIEFEDWDDYNEDDYPYIENDQEKGVCWLRAGWYESVNCEKCEDYWNSPLNVIEWLDESRVQSNNVGVNDAIEFADWLNKNASRNAVGSWGYFGNMFYTKTSKELYDIFKSESQPQQKEVDGYDDEM